MKNCTYYAESELFRGQAKSEMDHTCDGIQLIRRKTVFIADHQSVQQRAGQLYHFGSPHAGQGF